MGWGSRAMSSNLCGLMSWSLLSAASVATCSLGIHARSSAGWIGHDQHDDAPVGLSTVIRSRAAATVEEGGRHVLYGGSHGRRNRAAQNSFQLVCLARSSLHDHGGDGRAASWWGVKRIRECRDDLAPPAGGTRNPEARVCAVLRATMLGWTGHVCRECRPSLGSNWRRR